MMRSSVICLPSLCDLAGAGAKPLFPEGKRLSLSAEPTSIVAANEFRLFLRLGGRQGRKVFAAHQPALAAAAPPLSGQD
jgi:hypothetical protein